ncbi:MAG: Ig-like domain-containing protein [bacterium]|nr:Ig-like domain-containing protein [bacterium]
MNKKTIFILVSLLFLLLGLLLVRAMFQRQTLPPSPSLNPTPLTSPPSPTEEIRSDLVILSTVPRNGEAAVEINIPLRIVMNQPIENVSLTAVVTPRVDYATQKLGPVFFLTPRTTFEKNTQYTIDILSGNTRVGSFSFITGAQEHAGTAPDESSIQEQERFYLNNYPDVFLSNNIPFDSDQFFIKRGGVRPPPDQRNYFVVTLKGDRENSKEVFLHWLRSLGLTDTQIQTLDIEYQTQ